MAQVRNENRRARHAFTDRWSRLRIRTKVYLVMFTTLLATTAVVIANLKSISATIVPLVVAPTDPEITVSYMRVFGASQMRDLVV